MYHIPNDRRAYRSADSLYRGLLLCLETAAFENITVVDVVSCSDASRPTFYRLFDNTLDILHWKAEQIMLDALRRADPDRVESFRETFIAFISAWVGNKELLRALVKNSMTELLVRIHLDHIAEIKALLLSRVYMTEAQLEYLSYLLAAMIPATFQIWAKNPTEDPEGIFSRLQEAIAALKLLFLQ